MTVLYMRALVRYRVCANRDFRRTLIWPQARLSSPHANGRVPPRHVYHPLDWRLHDKPVVGSV